MESWLNGIILCILTWWMFLMTFVAYLLHNTNMVIVFSIWGGAGLVSIVIIDSLSSQSSREKKS